MTRYTTVVMADGMEVDPSPPAVRDKKRFEVKKVFILFYTQLFQKYIFSVQWNAVALWSWGE